MNYYELDPGEEFSGSVHTHLDQEESFFVLEGEATFETKPGPAAESETVHVTEGQIVRFDPGEYQQGRVAAPCQNCGESDYLDFALVDGEPALECPECGTEIEA